MIYSPTKEADRKTYQIVLEVSEIASRHGKASEWLPVLSWWKKRLETHNYANEDRIYFENTKTLRKRYSHPL